jgi:hypothetical protein
MLRPDDHERPQRKALATVVAAQKEPLNMDELAVQSELDPARSRRYLEHAPILAAHPNDKNMPTIDRKSRRHPY